jgi:D-threo-aldose 1-dehydrogenase
MKTRQLGGTGLNLTTIGFGGGPVGWLATPDADETARAALEAAWSAEIRYFDTAPFYGYGNSERRTGKFLREKEGAGFVLSSKVGRLIRPKFAGDRSPEQVVYDYSRDGALRSIEESLARLGLDKIDIALIHDIDGWTHGAEQPRRFAEAIDGAYRALSDLKAEGAIRAIGLGVNEWWVCRDFCERVPVDCFLLAGRVSLLEHEAQETFLPMCAERGIGLIIGGPFNSGILASGAVEGARYNYAPAPAPILARVRRMESICADAGVQLAAAALAYPLRQPAVATVIPGMASAAEVEAMRARLTMDVPESVWSALQALWREEAS